MRPPLQSSFQAPSISAINTARPRYRSHSPNTLLNDQIRSMIVVTSKISKSDRLEVLWSRQLARTHHNASLKNDHWMRRRQESWHDVFIIARPLCRSPSPPSSTGLGCARQWCYGWFCCKEATTSNGSIIPTTSSSYYYYHRHCRQHCFCLWLDEEKELKYIHCQYSPPPTASSKRRRRSWK